jgi:hypothetical protein
MDESMLFVFLQFTNMAFVATVMPLYVYKRSAYTY